MATGPGGNDRDELNRQYLPRYTLSNADALLAASERRSARVRRAVDGVLDLAYGDSPRQRLDIFPATHPGAPVLVFIHGGYWRATNITKSTYSHLAHPFVAAGATVVLPEYDLCPDVRIGDIVDQMRKALVWVHRNIKRYNGDPGAITVSGHSAGGHLTGMMVATDWRSYAGVTRQLVRASAPLSGLFDIRPHRLTDLQDDIRLSAASAKALSPMGLPAVSRGDALVAVGGEESDLFHWQSLQYAANLRAAGIRAEVMSTPKDNHFTITDRLGRSRDPLVRGILQLMG
ncbi:MAG: alpha/beta hydrolase [Pseudomonadota bacterium]